MESISDRVLLDVWDSAICHSLLEKSLLLISKCFPSRSFNEVACLTIGERDACLFKIRKQLFGSELHNVTTCPQCRQRIEWQTSVDSLCRQGLDLIWEIKPLEIIYKGQQVRFRIPNSTDILEIMKIENPDFRQRVLVERCLENASLPSSSTEGWPEDLMEAVIEKIEACDPLADITLDINCPDCGHRWTSCFDIMWFLWSEIDMWAKKLVQDVSVLAVNFGWSEHDILGMSHNRRNLYINQIYE